VLPLRLTVTRPGPSECAPRSSPDESLRAAVDVPDRFNLASVRLLHVPRSRTGDDPALPFVCFLEPNMLAIPPRNELEKLDVRPRLTDPFDAEDGIRPNGGGAAIFGKLVLTGEPVEPEDCCVCCRRASVLRELFLLAGPCVGVDCCCFVGDDRPRDGLCNEIMLARFAGSFSTTRIFEASRAASSSLLPPSSGAVSMSSCSGSSIIMLVRG